MEEQIYYAHIIDNTIEGYYCEDVHGDSIPFEECIKITHELWQYLLGLFRVEVIGTFSKKSVYGIEDANSFKMIEQDTNKPDVEDCDYSNEDIVNKVNSLKEELDRLMSILEKKGLTE